MTIQNDKIIVDILNNYVNIRKILSKQMERTRIFRKQSNKSLYFSNPNEVFKVL